MIKNKVIKIIFHQGYISRQESVDRYNMQHVWLYHIVKFPLIFNLNDFILE
jgi:hypothetical protein